MNPELIWEALVAAVALGGYMAMARYTKRDVNGLGRSFRDEKRESELRYRRVILALLLTCHDIDQCHEIARLLLG